MAYFKVKLMHAGASIPSAPTGIVASVDSGRWANSAAEHGVSEQTVEIVVGEGFGYAGV